MNLDRLRLLLQVVDSGSMSAAAQAAHLTQPAISRNIRLLEEELGVSLFEKAGRGVTLTPAGRALVPRARELVERIRFVVTEVQRTSRRAYFDVRLGAVDSVATCLLPQVIQPLRERFPGLALRLATDRTAALLKQVHAGMLDLVVVAHSGPPPEVRSLRVAPYVLTYWGRRDVYPTLARARSEEDLRQFPMAEIAPPPGQRGLVPDDALSYAVTSNVASVKALVMAGFGAGDFPDFMLDAAERAQLVCAGVEHDPQCAVYVVAAPSWRGDQESRIERALVTLLQEVMAARRKKSARSVT